MVYEGDPSLELFTADGGGPSPAHSSSASCHFASLRKRWARSETPPARLPVADFARENGLFPIEGVGPDFAVVGASVRG